MATRYIALLRGINVGGNNIIPMAALRAAFEAMGFDDVVTYIASGNVLFTSTSAARARLTTKIEAALGETFGYASRIVLLTAEDLDAVVRDAPSGFGQAPARYRYDVLFVKPPLTAAKVLGDVPRREGVDDVTAGTHALYFRRLVAKATQSRMSRIVQLPLYQSLTIRNWNTTKKLLALATEA